MQVNFVGRNIEVTAALKTFATEKLNHLQKRFDQITSVHVSFEVEHLDHIAEATVHLHGTEIHASAKADDMYKAVDALVDKLLGQITKFKEKIIEKHR